MGKHSDFRSTLESSSATVDEWIPGTQVIREAEALTGVECPVRFRRLLDLAASNRVPLELRNGRWGVWRSRLPAVAAALAMPRTRPAKPGPRSASVEQATA